MEQYTTRTYNTTTRAPNHDEPSPSRADQVLALAERFGFGHKAANPSSQYAAIKQKFQTAEALGAALGSAGFHVTISPQDKAGNYAQVNAVAHRDSMTFINLQVYPEREALVFQSWQGNAGLLEAGFTALLHRIQSLRKTQHFTLLPNYNIFGSSRHAAYDHALFKVMRQFPQFQWVSRANATPVLHRLNLPTRDERDWLSGETDYQQWRTKQQGQQNRDQNWAQKQADYEAEHASPVPSIFVGSQRITPPGVLPRNGGSSFVVPIDVPHDDVTGNSVPHPLTLSSPPAAPDTRPRQGPQPAPGYTSDDVFNPYWKEHHGAMRPRGYNNAGAPLQPTADQMDVYATGIGLDHYGTTGPYGTFGMKDPRARRLDMDQNASTYSSPVVDPLIGGRVITPTYTHINNLLRGTVPPPGAIAPGNPTQAPTPGEAALHMVVPKPGQMGNKQQRRIPEKDRDYRKLASPKDWTRDHPAVLRVAAALSTLGKVERNDRGRRQGIILSTHNGNTVIRLTLSGRNPNTGYYQGYVYFERVNLQDFPRFLAHLSIMLLPGSKPSATNDTPTYNIRWHNDFQRLLMFLKDHAEYLIPDLSVVLNGLKAHGWKNDITTGMINRTTRSLTARQSRAG